MRLRSEFIDGQIVDTDELYPVLDDNLRTIRLQVNKILVKFSILPVLGIFSLEQRALHALPIEALEFRTPKGSRIRNFEHTDFTGKGFERKFMETLAVVDHVKRSVDMRA